MGSGPIDDEALQRYLLGQLPEEEQRRLEERFFSDDECFEELLAVEDDLVYDYARDVLADRERELFERRFLGVDGTPQRVAAARAALERIIDRSATVPIAATPPASTATEAGARERSPRAGWTHDASWMRWAAVLALPASVAAIWLGLRTLGLQLALDDAAGERTSLQAQLATERQQREEATRALDAERRARQALDERLAAAEAAARRPGADGSSASAPPTLLSLVLTPGLVRGADTAARARVTPETTTLELRLQRDAGADQAAYASYRVTLRSADAKEVWRSPVLRASRAPIVVRIPARLLPAGDYEVTLYGVSPRHADEEIADYALTVSRP